MLMIYLAALDSDEERVKMADLYNNHNKRLMSVALTKTHNQDMAEDAVHSTFLAVIKHKQKVLAMDEIACYAT